jgi:hypothetical protein
MKMELLSKYLWKSVHVTGLKKPTCVPVPNQKTKNNKIFINYLKKKKKTRGSSTHPRGQFRGGRATPMGLGVVSATPIFLFVHHSIFLFSFSFRKVFLLLFLIL